MDLDVYTLSRLQFALTVMFHYLFPPLSIGLSWLMVAAEGAYMKTKDPEYEAVARFLTSLFAVIFAMGVVSGIVMEFQFGTNWSAYSRFVGDVFGSALAAEGVFAFFLESGFLAVLVFGWDRVKPRTHFISTVLVATGALFSSVWIIVANSWQQTPAGHKVVPMMVDGQPLLINGEPAMRAEVVRFWEVVFNPSTVHRLLHVLIGAGILGAFFVISISAYYILKGRNVSLARKMFTPALILAVVMSWLSLASGHFQARNVAATQPAKLAAFEGHFETAAAPLYAFGWPDTEEQKVKFGIGVPGALSFLVYDSFSKPVTGLNEFPREDWPPVNASFQTYHIMVALGGYFIAISSLAAFLHWRGRLFQTRWLMWLLVFSIPGPYIANQMGWAAAEIGRQPWIVYGLMRTEQAFSPSLSAGQVLGSIIVFVILYAALFALWLFIMDTKIRRGPGAFLRQEGHAEGSGGFLETAAALADPAGPSLTSARE